MKALALLSGGLDSTLAIKVILEHGIEVEAISFVTPFCLCSRGRGCGHAAASASNALGVELSVFDIGAEAIENVKQPKHGYGKNLNPCIDCRILMHRKAKAYMKECHASFIITGEVLGQRPKSQHRTALGTIERESGLEGLILRPLSAGLLPPTIPEKSGWVDRAKLLAISGRSRKPQIALAEQYGLADYPCPAGGCLLTDPEFSQRMRDLMTHSEVTLDEIRLLKVGRHFRLTRGAKIVVGRNEQENMRLTELATPSDLCYEPVDVPGPTAVGRGEFDGGTTEIGARIVARYCDKTADDCLRIAVRRLPDGDEQVITARPMDEKAIDALRIQSVCRTSGCR
jgi:tRNA U34 2-thiouridine synthase MnmA/TrmU